MGLYWCLSVHVDLTDRALYCKPVMSPCFYDHRSSVVKIIKHHRNNGSELHFSGKIVDIDITTLLILEKKIEITSAS